MLQYGYRLVVAFVVAYPATKTIGAIAASFPGGDRALFEPGGFYLLEALRVGSPPVPAAIEGAAVVGVLLAFGGLFPLAVSLEVLRRPSASLGDAVRRGAARFPTFAVVGAVTVLAQAAVITLASGALGALPLHSFLNERNADVLLVGLAAAPALGVFALGVVEDLVRGEMVSGTEAPLSALFRALQTLRSRPGDVLRRLWLPSLGAPLLALAAVFATTGIDVSRPGALRVSAVFAMHQLVVLGIVVLRTEWFRGALALANSAVATDSGDGLAVDLDVAMSGAIPGEIEPHDAPPE
jgi:hypothetical protein